MKPYRIADLGSRLPQAGRIRLGHKVRTKSGKQAPESLRTFRFTSSDRASLEKVAGLYGGTVRPWADRSSPDKFELYSEVSEIKIALPPDPLRGTPIFELWKGGGNQRRCDGEICTLPRGGGPHGEDPQEKDCLCAAEGILRCKVTTRLSVILPDVRFLGTWRLDSRGRNAAEEIPGMVDGVRAVERDLGITPAILRLVERITWDDGVKQEYVVPVIGVDASPNELAAGSVRLGIEGGVREQRALDPRAEPKVAGELIVGHGPLPLPETPTTPVPADPELVQAWFDELPRTRQNRVLNRAREIAAELGRVVPIIGGEIPSDILDHVMGEMLWDQ